MLKKVSRVSSLEKPAISIYNALKLNRKKKRSYMRLYHTSDREIKHPDIYRGRKNADFGQGFYLTPDREFAYRWAGRNVIVNCYDFDETGLYIHRFERSLDWFTYIYNNWRLRDGLEADAVIGPIANDTIFDTIGIISSGFLAPEEALALLMIGPAYIQVALRTEKAISRLTWLSAETITGQGEEKRRREQQAYQEAFAKKMESLGVAED